MKIKNNDDVSHVWCGQTIEAGASYTIDAEEYPRWRGNEQLLSTIENELAQVLDDSDNALGAKTTVAALSGAYRASLAVDKNGADQSLSGTDWIEVTASRKIWDIGDNFDLETNNFTVPFDGTYFHDGEMHLVDLSGVTAIELACFKRGDPDDYWFILDKKIIASETEAQLSSATMFDFYEDEKYCLKIRLEGTNPSATIDGNDDYTAFGFTFKDAFYWF